MSSKWMTAIRAPHLEPGVVHIWLLALDESISTLVQDSLSKPELERAAAFRFPVHRNEFVIARGVLRSLLGKYLDVEPASIDIKTSDMGKPYLSPQQSGDLQFNISHSGGFAAFGFSYGLDLGLDI